MKSKLAACILVASAVCASRTLTFSTSQVTGAAVTLSPDGRTLVFTMLGHLFSVPVTGGRAEQLTFGLSYDDAPAFSPDSSQIAFVSDRDSSEGNIFLLSLKSRQITQLTHEPYAAQPVWSPDGKSLVYLRYSRRREAAAVVARIPAVGGPPETLTAPPRRLGQPFYRPTAQLAWTVIEPDPQSGGEITRIETLSSTGTASTLKTIPGAVDRVVATPTAFYGHRVTGAARFNPGFEELVLIPTAARPAAHLTPVTRMGCFALSPDTKSLYIGDQGHLWKVLLPGGVKQALSFHADVKLELQEISQPVSAPSPEANSARVILTPRLSPDGRTLVFAAAGFLWKQPLAGGKAERITTQGSASEWEPAFSPDGRLAYVHTERGEDSLRLLDLATGRETTLASAAGISSLAWSRDGQRLVAVTTAGFDQIIESFNIADGKREQLGEAGFWSPRPQLSADGRALFFSADTTGVGNLYRRVLAKDASPEAVTSFTRHLSDARLSADEKWIVFRRNHSIQIAPLAQPPASDSDVREISPEGGDSFALTPDGTFVIYSVGAHVFRQPLAGGRREEIRVALALPRSIAPPLLLRATRLLDFDTGTFSPPTSLLIQNGRIQSVGDAADRNLPNDAVVIDAAGRFAIPGLFDLHVHAVGANEEAFLAYGVTSLRDTGGPIGALNALQDRAEFTSLPVPRYFFSGEIFEGDHPIWGDGFLQFDNQDDARAYVRRFHERGATFIKVYPSLSWPLKRAVADEAHKLGLPVVGHGSSPEEIIRSVALGFFSLEHNSTLNRDFDDIIQMLAASGTRWDPTVAVTGGDSLLLREEPERLADPKFKTFTPSSSIEFAESADYYKSLPTGELRGTVASEIAAIAAAHAAGARFLIGTDAPNPSVFFGSSLHWELARFVEAGFSPLEVIRLATTGAAEAVGAHDVGSLQKDRRADLVLLDANPLLNIRNTEKIWRVVKAGWLFDPNKLK
ncbi:MAG TPA: amidohydrolase family protein [Bryobacteraceae bacterium]|nr:amidohydrolase family protein [Bryobacteraceae bacterium]